MKITLESDIRALDEADELRAFRDEFYLPDGMIYLDGNSLGPAPKATFAEMERAIREEWAEGLITSWNGANWFTLTDSLGDQLAAQLGGETGELVVCDTTSANIYKTLHAALSIHRERPVIVAESGSFPTDLYVVEGVASTRQDIAIRLEGIDAPTIEELLDESVAVVLLNHVDYRTGRLRDMATLTAAAHAVGALVVWDLCHSVGVVPMDLNKANVDFAVGCTYKYLNGGPGAPAFIFAARRHHGRFEQPLSGWWGHKTPFAFEPEYQGDPGVRRFLCGTQPVLSLRALQPALAISARADRHAVRAKSERLTNLFIELVEQRCGGFDIGLLTPRESAQRGSHVSLTHAEGYPIVQALIARGVIGDFRAPNVMRFGFAPLYLSYQDVWNAVSELKDVLMTEAWREPKFQERAAVT